MRAGRTRAIPGVARLGSGLALLALAVAAPAASQTPPLEVLSLDQAIALALQNNRNVGQAALQVQRAEQRVAAARTRRLPSLDFTALAGTTLNTIRVSYPEGAFGTYAGIGPIPATDTIVEAPRAMSGSIQATLAQPLTQLHRIGLNTKLQELGRDVEQQKLRAQRAATVADVRGLYYGLVQAASGVRARQQEVDVYRELERVVDQQVALEVALPADGLDVKSRLANARYELLALQGDLQSGKERLNELLGRDLALDFAVEEVTETRVEELDLQLALAQALERRADLAQARLDVERADTDRRLKKAESIPELNLALTYLSFVNVDLLPRNVAQLGLQLKWEPFDWGRRGKEQAEKALQVEQAKSSAKQAEDRARIEVGQRFRKLQEARLHIEAERLGREAAVERLRVARARQAQEAVLYKDVLEAQAASSAAQARYDEALATFWTAKADFQKALGEEL